MLHVHDGALGIRRPAFVGMLWSCQLHPVSHTIHQAKQNRTAVGLLCLQIVDSYSEELGLGKSDSKQSHAIVSAHGAKKLAALVAAVRTVQFMDRYAFPTMTFTDAQCTTFNFECQVPCMLATGMLTCSGLTACVGTMQT